MKKYSIQVMLILFFMTAVALLLLNGSLFVSANAETYSEIESNDSSDSANYIPINTKISGKLNTKSDKDWYKFSTPSVGYYSIIFDHPYISSDADYWEISFYDENGQNWISSSEIVCKVKGNITSTTSCSIGVPAGTYMIKIGVGSNYYYSESTYSFVVNFVGSTRWECESNNEKKTANSIQVNTFYKGALTASSDADWYRFSVNTETKMYLTFNHPYINSSDSYWDIFVYNSSDTSVFSWGRRGNTEEVTSDSFTLSSGTYYMKVIPHYAGFWGTYWKDYDYEFMLMAEHDHKGTWKDIGPVTCMGMREQERVCEICGLVETQEAEPIGHRWDEGVYLEDATLLQIGEVEHRCLRCGERTIMEDKSVVWLWWPIIVGAVMLIFGIACFVHLQKHS